MKTEPGTIIRTALLIMALINQILVSTGHSVLPVTDEQVSTLISLVFTCATTMWAWWKNNSFTDAAKQADEYMNTLKNKK